ncbi:PBP1A family penicillin-binding protein [Limimaricola pyoseonensis]|uniref:Lectin-like protein BA14k n=1 Tax=Limimaricola pyoseonensis TaxID=521013 RepID=A0A1G7ASW7_9RHOB|nr:PBP1A family penicillin-binding protein [Limimaricola pyoseonensis]SDE17812.1 penicillin-binding protein, 1A family [Limimaricola pyoseonensis]
MTSEDQRPTDPTPPSSGASAPERPPERGETDLAQAAQLFWAALMRALARAARGLGRGAAGVAGWSGRQGSAALGAMGRGGQTLAARGSENAAKLKQKAAEAAAARRATRDEARDATEAGAEGEAPQAPRPAAPRVPIQRRIGDAWRAAGARRRARLEQRTLRPAAAVRATRWVWRSVFAVSFVLLFLAVLAGGVLVWAVRDLPLADMLPPLEEPTLTVENQQGETLFSRGAYRAGYVALADMPAHLPQAVSAIEDRRFWDHPGIDIEGIGRAAWRNLRSGGVVEGGSTITQQLVKVLYLDPDRTYKRKLQEMVLALGLERQLGKERIMELYLNSTYLGSGAWGMPAAAQIYFDKPVQELSLAESAILAASIRAPSVINPEADLARARERGATVLGVMADLGMVEPAAAEAARSELAALEPSPPPARAGSYFADWVLSEAQELAGAVDGPMTVTATLDPELQARAEQILQNAIADRGGAAGASQGAIVAMTPEGHIKAMVGGVDYGASQFNRATDALRQPGSTFKLPVYLAALVMGAEPNMLVPDEPIDIDGYKPQNFTGNYAGNVPLNEAFSRSLNAAAVRLGQEVGIDNVITVARQLGIEGKLTETPSLALGTSEVTLLDMTEAYAAILAGRAPIRATGISNLKLGETGVALSVSGADPNAVKLNRTREPMLRMLRQVVTDGTGKRAQIPGFAAGKTGTSQNSRDGWFIGFTDSMVIGVWIGNDDNSPMQEVTGGGLPAEIWREVALASGGSNAQAAPAAQPAQPAPQPQQQGQNAQRLRQQAGAQAAQSCNVRACSRAYRSFRASDCTFQPYSGPRKLCTR